MGRSSVKAVLGRVGSRLLKDLTTATQIDVLGVDIWALEAAAVRAVEFAHDELVVDLQWVQRENSKTEDRGFGSREVALEEACDPAPL